MKKIHFASFFKGLIRDWKTKLVALVVAVVVYIFGFYMVNVPRSVKIPLNVILPKNYEPYSNIPSDIEIVIHASGDAKYLVDPTLIRATVDFSSVNSDTIESVPVDLMFDTGILKKGVVSIDPRPTFIRVAFRKKIEKTNK